MKKKETILDLNLLSEFRSELMGVAILLVVLYHFCNTGGTTVLDKGLRFVFSHGYVGVDIFFVVSGLGLTYSLRKNSHLKEYYLKRWIRIFPFYIFITLVECWLIRGESLEQALLRSTTLGYWFGFPYRDWFTPALITFYATYPLFYHFFIKLRKIRQALFLSLLFFVLSVIMAFFFEYKIDWQHFAMLYRVPDFILGCIIGIVCSENVKKKFVKLYIIISIIIGFIILFVQCFCNLKFSFWLVNLCFTPLYLAFLCNLFYKIKQSPKMIYIDKIFMFLGMVTFELYMISLSFERLLTDSSCPKYHYLFVLICLIICIILSYIVHLLFERMNKSIIHGLLKK